MLNIKFLYILMIYSCLFSMEIKANTINSADQHLKESHFLSATQNSHVIQHPKDVIEFFTFLQSKNFLKESINKNLNIQNTIKNLFSFIWANKKFNKELMNYQKSHHDDNEVITALIEYSYKTQFSYAKIVHKTENLSQKIQLDEDIKTEEKLDIRELRKIVSLDKLNSLFRDFKDWGIYEILLEDQNFKNLANQVSKASDFYKLIFEKSQEDQLKYKGISIVAYDFSTDFLYRNISETRYRILKSLFSILVNTDIEHISIAFHNKDHSYESHMWGMPSRYSVTERNISTYLFYTYKLNLISLIPSQDKYDFEHKFLKLYGSKWPEKIEKKLEKVAGKHLLNVEHFNKLHNPKFRRIQSFFGVNLKISDQTISKQTKFSDSGKVTCSEFVAKAIIQNIQLLNKEIKKDWIKKFHNDEAPYLKFPIKSHKNLKFLTPQQYFNFLKKNHLIITNPLSSIIDKTIRIKSRNLI